MRFDMRLLSRAGKKPQPAKAVALLSRRVATGSSTIIEMERAYAAHNYSPLPVVFAKAQGVKVTDPEGRKYYDFLSGYGTVSQGHLNKEIAKAMRQQMDKCTLSSRAFFSSNFGPYSKFITTFFGYDRVVAMNTGAEGVETAVKIARKWGYEVKKIPPNRALIVCCEGNFHGRTILAVSMSDDEQSFGGFGPYVPNIVRVPYGDSAALARLFRQKGHLIAGFVVEPIQGEAGVKIPPTQYLRDARRLCDAHRVLLVADEVQCGIGRSGKLLASEHSGVRPDMVILAKALGGGFMPVSAVLADEDVMKVITPGIHGSTFGGNPLANAVAMAALKEVHRRKLVQNSRAMGALLLREVRKAMPTCRQIIREIRGKGLFMAIEFQSSLLEGKAAMKFMYLLKDRGILAKVTHGHTIRMSPPLVITRTEVLDAARRIRGALVDLTALVRETK